LKQKPFKTHQPCPLCKGSDSASIWPEGNGHCHSCGKDFNTGQKQAVDVADKDAYEKIHKIRPLPDVYHEMPDRGISAATARKYGVTAIQDAESKWAYVYPHFDDDNKHIANKLRLRNKKEFIWEGDVKRSKLFGRQAFPAGGKIITITEGNDDAMAVYEMFGRRYPSVSVHSAGEAVRNCVDDFEYLNSFETIVINFDKDEAKVNPQTGEVHYPGQEAAIAVANLFAIGKVRVLTLQDAKDANDYLLSKWAEKYTKEWWAAPTYTPSGLKLGRDMWDEISAEDNYETISYPWETANYMTYGLRLSEVLLLTADTGVGKTSVVAEIEYHVLKNSDKGIGFLHLEEPNKHTARSLMSIAANRPLHLPDVRADTSPEELRGWFDSTVNTDRVVIWDHFGSNSIHEVLAKIRHMHALGCKYIFLDHLSILVSDQSGDERKQLDEVSTKLKMICMELNIAVVAVIHINRAGLIRGSAGPEQVANIVWQLYRDKEDPDPWRRNVTKIVCKKNRFCGRTGPMTYLWYNENTGRLTELDKEAIAKFEAGGAMKPEEQW
jgi:DnaB helicase-like protein